MFPLLHNQRLHSPTTVLTRRMLIVPAWLNIADINFKHDEAGRVSFEQLPLSDLCLANGLWEGQFFNFSYPPQNEQSNDNSNDRAIALAMIWMDRHTNGKFSRSLGYAPIQYEFDVAENLHLALKIPRDLPFSALNIHLRPPTYFLRFNHLALQRLCLANDVDFAQLMDGLPADGPLGEAFYLIYSWYILHRRAGGAPDPLIEGMIQDNSGQMVFTLRNPYQNSP